MAAVSKCAANVSSPRRSASPDIGSPWPVAAQVGPSAASCRTEIPPGSMQHLLLAVLPACPLQWADIPNWPLIRYNVGTKHFGTRASQTDRAKCACLSGLVHTGGNVHGKAGQAICEGNYAPE